MIFIYISIYKSPSSVFLYIHIWTYKDRFGVFNWFSIWLSRWYGVWLNFQRCGLPEKYSFLQSVHLFLRKLDTLGAVRAFLRRASEFAEFDTQVLGELS